MNRQAQKPGQIPMNYNQLEGNRFKSLRIIVGLSLAIIIIAYSLFEAFDILCGPTLIISSPQNGQTIKDSLIQINGSTKRIAKMYIDGRQIFAHNDGGFSEPLLLGYGYNIIEVKVTDQFGRQITKKLGLVLE